MRACALTSASRGAVKSETSGILGAMMGEQEKRERKYKTKGRYRTLKQEGAWRDEKRDEKAYRRLVYEYPGQQA